MIRYKNFIEKNYLIYIYAICNFLFKATIIIIPTITQKIIDAAVENNIEKLIKFGKISLVIVIIFIILMYSVSKITVLLYGEIDYSLKEELAKKITNGKYLSIKEKKVGYYLQRHTTDIEQIRFLYFEKKIDLIVNVLFFIGLFFAMATISIKLSLGLLIAVPVFIVINKIAIPKIEKKAEIYLKNEESLNSEFESLYNNGHSARAMRVIKNLYSSYCNQNDLTKKTMIDYNLSDEKYNAIVVGGILNICNTFIYFVGGLLVINGELTVGELLAMAIYFGRIWSPIEFFLGFRKKVAKAKVSEERIEQLLNFESKECKEDEKIDFENIDFENIDFSYDKKRIFHNQILSLEKNKLYYLRGNNGSGKSTLLDLMAGIIESKINIKVDGKSINDTNQFLQNNIFYIPSELFLLDNELLLNHKVIQHVVGNSYININELSSGEKRVIQIGSALNRKELIILIDEPLNYVGVENIEYVLDLIEKIKANHIVIISSHNSVISRIAERDIHIKNSKIYIVK